MKMKSLLRGLVVACALVNVLVPAHAAGEKWMDGKVSYKFAGVDGQHANPADACKAGVEDLAKRGNKKTFVSVKDGTTSTAMTCVLKESDGSPFEQMNVVNKILDCPAGTSPRSTDNSGQFSAMRCRCDDARKGCPK